MSRLAMKRIFKKRLNEIKSNPNSHNNRHSAESSSQRNSCGAESKLLKQTIDNYNNHTRGLPLTIDNDGITFSGFIKVRLNLKNPVKICSNDLSLKNIVNNMKKSKSKHHEKPKEADESQNQFQMIKIPTGTLTVLHVKNSTTTEEILNQLFEKYNIEKSSKLYQLYTESMNDKGETVKTPLKWCECPLDNVLMWGPKNQNFFLVLEEFYSYILDEFSLFEVPELVNFLKIITKRRENQLEEVNKKFNDYKLALETLILEK